MAHSHEVTDQDAHFLIDTDSRKVENPSGELVLMQFDHQSERITFEMPRYVEEHDMTLCNRIEIHYINTGRGSKYSGVYEVSDLQLKGDQDNTIIFSWLVTGNATQYAGKLSFIIRFACVADGNIDYAWNTAVYSKITVSDGIYNTNVVVEEYADVLAEWEERISTLEKGGGSLSDDDMLAILIETNMLSAVSDNDGAVLTDENNKILLM